MDWGGIALIGTGLGLGLRHGIDWDHIAAITDITSTTTDASPQRAPVQRASIQAGLMTMSATRDGGMPDQVAQASWSRGASSGHAAVLSEPATWSGQVPRWWPSEEARERFFLATLYALGHALVVAILGLLAIWASEMLPTWIDPIMERIVGITLVVLGSWILYQLCHYGRDFKLRSRWMLIFALAGRSWAWVRTRVTGTAHHHRGIEQYGKRTAFGIGLIHGIGAETGSQALLLAGAAGATTRTSGSVLLGAFVVGLLCSNSLIAGLSTCGFVSTQARKNVYFVIGMIAAVFSLAVGLFFVTGQDVVLPDLTHLLGAD